MRMHNPVPHRKQPILVTSHHSRCWIGSLAQLNARDDRLAHLRTYPVDDLRTARGSANVVSWMQFKLTCDLRRCLAAVAPARAGPGGCSSPAQPQRAASLAALSHAATAIAPGSGTSSRTSRGTYEERPAEAAICFVRSAPSCAAAAAAATADAIEAAGAAFAIAVAAGSSASSIVRSPKRAPP
mmetsp:Transcript_24132/g.52679  ORF Transcript_24132/g.52679 Transcript_24132/m.52679 type:complete len:184 (+) Transcript_24132:820-1371(+)